jgi:hypothetical protein
MLTYWIPFLQHYTYPQGPTSVSERNHVVSLVHISSHTTHTSPYRRQIGKHIWRKRFDAHAGQPQTARFCRARAVSCEQTRRVDTENAIAKKSGALKSAQVLRPVCICTKSARKPVRDLESEGPSYPPYDCKRLYCSSSIGRQERPWLLPRSR